MALRTNTAAANQRRPAWKQKITRELIRYCLSFGYLVFFLGGFAWYRRAILAEYGISYLHYGAATIEALILAKVIWLGELLRLGRTQEDKPLIYPTLSKAIEFSLFVGFFAIIEHIIGGLVHGVGVAGGLAELWHEGKYELIGRCLVTFFAFIPFFAFRELARAMGEGKMSHLFFRKKAVTESGTLA
jgi:hypothetical protein